MHFNPKGPGPEVSGGAVRFCEAASKLGSLRGEVCGAFGHEDDTIEGLPLIEDSALFTFALAWGALACGKDEPITFGEPPTTTGSAVASSQQSLVPLTSTVIPLSTLVPAATYEPTATPIPARMSAPIPTAASRPTSTPVPAKMSTPIPIAASLPTATPVLTSIPSPVEPAATPEPIAVLKPTSSPTHTAQPTHTQTPIATPTSTPTPTHSPMPTSTPTPAPTNTPTLSSMVSDVSGGIVQIITPSGTGSGFIIDTDGLVVTNAHVVLGFKIVDVRLPSGQIYQGEVLGMDEIVDIALLDLRASEDFDPVTLGDSDVVAVGEDVIAMGYPLGDVDILLGSPTITRGIVSAKRVSDAGCQAAPDRRSAINPGSSGGPLFDRDGQVVGVNTSKLLETGDGRPVEGIGMAVAINEVRDRLDTLARGGVSSTPTQIQGTADRTVYARDWLEPSSSVSAGLVHSCGVKD